MSYRLQLSPGKSCASHVVPIAQPGPNKLAREALVAHLGQIFADELSSLVQSLKICADELSPIAQAGKTCVDERSSIAQPGKT